MHVEGGIGAAKADRIREDIGVRPSARHVTQRISMHIAGV